MIKVGDWVRIKTWDAMAQEYRKSGADIIIYDEALNHVGTVVDAMEKYCGKDYKVNKVFEDHGFTYYYLDTVGSFWSWTREMFEIDEVTITVNRIKTEIGL